MKKKPNQVDFLANCSVCDNPLNPVDMIVLNEKEQKTTMHVTCAKCHSAAIVFLVNNQMGMLSVGIATDLNSSEVREKFDNEAISSDDIIDLHQFVAIDGGDIMQLIKNS